MKALIVDDEAPARQRLRRLLDGLGQKVEVIGECSDGIQALEQIHSLEPEVVFLDIEMPELDGLAVARCLGQNPPHIVFVTAFSEHAVKAFELAAADYLVKPVNEDRLRKTIERLSLKERSFSQPELSDLLKGLSGSSDRRRIAVKCGGKFLVLDPTKVSAILARNHYAALIVDGKELLSDDGLDVWMEKLRLPEFIRIHRSAIINLEFLKELHCTGDRKYNAVLSDTLGTLVPVSRERLSVLKARLGLTDD